MKKKKDHSQITKNETENTLKLTFMAYTSSLGIALSVLSIFIPNVEFVSFTIFFITLLFGFSYGLFSMISISLVYEFIITPVYGSSGLILPLKLMGYFLLVLITKMFQKSFLKLSWWELGLHGSFFALFYDVITTIGIQLFILQTDLTFVSFFTILIIGFPFTISHILSNFVIFSSSKIVVTWLETAYEARGLSLLSIMNVKCDSCEV